MQSKENPNPTKQKQKVNIGNVDNATHTGRDLELDVALVAITLPPGTPPLPEIELGDSDALAPGDGAVPLARAGRLYIYV